MCGHKRNGDKFCLNFYYDEYIMNVCVYVCEETEMELLALHWRIGFRIYIMLLSLNHLYIYAIYSIKNTKLSYHSMS